MEKTSVSKKNMVDAISKLPEDATVEDAMHELYVLHKVDLALKDKRPTLTQQEAEHEIKNHGSEQIDGK